MQVSNYKCYLQTTILKLLKMRHYLYLYNYPMQADILQSLLCPWLFLIHCHHYIRFYTDIIRYLMAKLSANRLPIQSIWSHKIYYRKVLKAPSSWNLDRIFQRSDNNSISYESLGSRKSREVWAALLVLWAINTMYHFSNLTGDFHQIWKPWSFGFAFQSLSFHNGVSVVSSAYSISQEICTRFCCALLCCGYAIVHNEFTWSIYPYSSGLLCCHWGNR